MTHSSSLDTPKRLLAAQRSFQKITDLTAFYDALPKAAATIGVHAGMWKIEPSGALLLAVSHADPALPVGSLIPRPPGVFPAPEQVEFYTPDPTGEANLPVPFDQFATVNIDNPSKQYALLPFYRHNQLIAVLLFWHTVEMGFTPEISQLIENLAVAAQLKHNALLAEEALEKLERALTSLAAISQAISVDTDLDRLYQVIHHQIIQTIGEVDFIIALYDETALTISIPYAMEQGKLIHIPAFPLGEGLTSILIRSRRPLLLVGNIAQQAQELGAKVIGVPAKSWLGVPMLLAGEVVGALIVQDLNREDRFDLEDQRLLSSMATHVATTMRHANLLLAAQQRAQNEKLVTEISARIWEAAGIDAVLQTALRELGEKLGADDGLIEIYNQPIKMTPIN